MSDALVQSLADAAGIESHYWDIQGHRHDRTPDTARHLLRALRIPAQSDAEIAESLSLLSNRQWREIIPSVVVAHEGEDIGVQIHLSAQAAVKSLRWSLHLENGDEIVGDELPATLPVIASRDVDGTIFHRLMLKLPRLPLGYHKLSLASNQTAIADLIVAPIRCYLPLDGEPTRDWGVSVQLYSVRSQKNWGIGDFRDLDALVAWGASRNAGFIGLNPLHSLFWDAPENASPYCPSSRLFLNALYLDVEAIPEFAESEEVRNLVASSDISIAIRAARAADFVDYHAVAVAKNSALRRLHHHFEETHARIQDDRAADFRCFLQRGGDNLKHFAAFQALSEKMQTHDWMRRWPSGFRNPMSPDVAEFSHRSEADLRFFQYLQWQCEVQHDAIAKRTKNSSMRLGLYRDLAVSVEANSGDHWANQPSYLAEAVVGAPPDPFNEQGQEWGVVPLDPTHLSTTGYRHFVALLRANMRGAGALRVDHVMGWERLFVIPAGAMAQEGAYLRFPFHDLVSIAALESHRNSCVVIGEDLGTVRAGFREEMNRAGVLSYKVLYFEKHHSGFRRPEDFPDLALLTATTHDLATLRGYWTCEDIATKVRLGLLEEENRYREQRRAEKRQLIEALKNEGLVSQQIDASNDSDLKWTNELAYAINAYLAKSNCMLVAVQLDDLVGEQQQVNLPGTSNEYPNWRRRVSSSLEEIANNFSVNVGLESIDRCRKKAVRVDIVR